MPAGSASSIDRGPPGPLHHEAHGLVHVDGYDGHLGMRRAVDSKDLVGKCLPDRRHTIEVQRHGAKPLETSEYPPRLRTREIRRPRGVKFDFYLASIKTGFCIADLKLLEHLVEAPLGCG